MVDVAAPSLSVAVMVTIWLSSGPSLVSNAQLQVPSPLSTIEPIEADSVTSSTPGSLNVPEFEAVSASLTVTLALSAATLGATFSTIRANVVDVAAPSLSAAVIVTIWLSSGPSLVSNDQLQVPLPLSITVPTEADSVTSSTPGSLNVPVFSAVSASLTVTPALSAATLGATLLTVRSNAVETTPPLPSLAAIVTVWLSSGPSLVSNDQVQPPAFPAS